MQAKREAQAEELAAAKQRIEALKAKAQDQKLEKARLQAEQERAEIEARLASLNMMSTEEEDDALLRELEAKAEEGRRIKEEVKAASYCRLCLPDT